MRTWPLIAFTLLAGPATASKFFGTGTYPQFRSMIATPGSGFAINPQGKLDFNGAMALSTPVAYSLTGLDAVIGGSVLSPDSKFAFGLGSGTVETNGSGQFLIGIDLKDFGDLTFGYLVLSEFMDNAQNFHWTPPNQTGKSKLGIGMLDMTGQAGTAGETTGPNRFDPGESRTYYAVLSTQLGQSSYVSFGFGDGRYKGRFFANASANIAKNLKAVAEWDVFNVNVGLAYDIGKLGSIRQGRATKATAFIGLLDGNRAYWSLNVQF